VHSAGTWCSALPSPCSGPLSHRSHPLPTAPTAFQSPQIKLLKILAALGAGDRAAAENMAAVLHQTLRRANTSHTIGSAIIYECVRTITTIYPNPQLLAAGGGHRGRPAGRAGVVGIIEPREQPDEEVDESPVEG
jgi:hypothetical protein